MLNIIVEPQMSNGKIFQGVKYNSDNSKLFEVNITL